jgi:phosphatidylglycerol:prolipoprotein diacylglycerol transferase
LLKNGEADVNSSALALQSLTRIKSSSSAGKLLKKTMFVAILLHLIIPLRVDHLLYINKTASVMWDPDGTIIDLGLFTLRYYSLFFLLAFLSAYLVLQRKFKSEGIKNDLLDKLTTYVFLGTLIGARLGHCLFYDFSYYWSHPLEIILPVRFKPTFRLTGFQGLASHGGGLGIMISLMVFIRKHNLKLWFLLDQVSLIIPLAGFFIRLGNLMNSEIIGKPSQLPWAFIFVKEDLVLRHPTQLYEALAYLCLSFILYLISGRHPKQQGFYFGLMLTLLFTFRFLIEFCKEYQSAFEAHMWLSMGQVLSIPFIGAGLLIVLLKSNNVAYDLRCQQP